MKGYLVFITTIELQDEDEPDYGISGRGTDDEVLARANEVVHESWAQDGPPTPWLLDDEEMSALERELPLEKPA